jgi:hypothetical protein
VEVEVEVGEEGAVVVHLKVREEAVEAEAGEHFQWAGAEKTERSQVTERIQLGKEVAAVAVAAC